MGIASSAEGPMRDVPLRDQTRPFASVEPPFRYRLIATRRAKRRSIEQLDLHDCRGQDEQSRTLPILAAPAREAPWRTLRRSRSHQRQTRPSVLAKEHHCRGVAEALPRAPEALAPRS